MTFRDGALQRWRIVNAAKSRYFDLVLGDGQPFMLIGSDGGPLEYSVKSTHLVIAPGERADVLVAPRAEKGQPIVLRTIPYDRGFGSTEFRTVEDLLTLVPAALPPVPAASLPEVRATVVPMSAAGATPVRIDLGVNMSLGEFNMTSTSATPPAKGGGAMKDMSMPNTPRMAAALGETQLWTITNHAQWAHPMHLHGFFFQVVDEQGAPVHPYVWKDTVDVPVDGTVRLLVKLDREGSWMFHCHILDHADAGMMSMVDVGESAPAHDHVSSGP
jgi:FtsP/CotA-like multicopper oxidase with cupredoxin domain